MAPGPSNRRFRRALALVAGVGLVGFILWAAFAPGEPSYGGKPLSAWLRQAAQAREIGDAFSDVEINTPSAVAIRAMGKDALPPLLRMARTRDTAMRRNLIQFSQNQPWLGWQPQSLDEIQMNAACGFMFLGPAAKPALRELIRMLNDSDYRVRTMAAFALGRIGSEATNSIPALEQCLDRARQSGTNPAAPIDDTLLAAFALGRMGPAARHSLPLLASLQNHPHLVVREAAQGVWIRINGNGQGLEPSIES